mgnify:CR=1 FL=1
MWRERPIERTSPAGSLVMRIPSPLESPSTGSGTCCSEEGSWIPWRTSATRAPGRRILDSLTGWLPICGRTTGISSICSEPSCSVRPTDNHRDSTHRMRMIQATTTTTTSSTTITPLFFQVHLKKKINLPKIKILRYFDQKKKLRILTKYISLIQI